MKIRNNNKISNADDDDDDGFDRDDDHEDNEFLRNRNNFQIFYPYDYEIVSSLTTFEHLVYLCENSAIPSPDVVTSRQSSPPATPGQRIRDQKKEENAYRSASTVNLVQFPFNLQSLLPRSQQAELLFSTFVIGDAKTESQDDMLDPKEPNELLLGLFYDKLKESHNNEILLSADDCSRFVQQVLDRERDHDTFPVPFIFKPGDNMPNKFEDFPKSSSDTEHNTTGTLQDNSSSANKRSNTGSSGSCRSTPGQTSASTDHSSKRSGDFPVEADGSSVQDSSALSGSSKHLHSKHSNQQTPIGNSLGNMSMHNKLKRAGSNQCPMWKCYIKMDCADHLLMTFVPASFEDLLLLNPAPVTSSPDDSSLAQDIVQPTDPTAFLENLLGTSLDAEDVVITELPPILPTFADKQKTSKEETHRDSVQIGSSTTRQISISLPDGIDTAVVEDARDMSLPDREKKNENVQDWVNSSSRCMKTAVSGELRMPVYAYSCQLKNVTASLTDRWSFTLPEDIVQDFSFKSDQCCDDNASDEEKSPRARLQPFDVLRGVLEQEDQDHGGSLDRRSTDSTSIRTEAFKEHCQMLADLYFNSFVTGVFLSLQQSYYVDSRDVDAAINNICEEAHPLETDMTTYLLASCSHMQTLVYRGRRQEKRAEEAENGVRGSVRGSGGAAGGGDVDGGVKEAGDMISDYPRQYSVRFQDFDLQKEDEAPKIPEALQLPNQLIELSAEEWGNFSSEECHRAKEQRRLMELVKERFQEAFGLCLKQVPTLPDFYFYCPSNGQINPGDDLDEDKDSETPEAEDGAEEVEVQVEDDDEIIIGGDEQEPSLQGTSMESNPKVSSIGSFDGNISTDSMESCDPLPLFVHFTCTLKQKHNLQHVSVRRIPVCLGDIAKSVEEPLTSIDFGDFKVTFDINCLTLLSDQPKKPSFLRLLSGQSGDGQRKSVDDANSSCLR
ncbi:protein szt2-like isoform x1 [Plakobranchus ocellatus]|uniref:Protein szt2-like isoform x1 n=1 Tax=Plakobranchus ocellatus TaxID=259542 RepID=A0AAV3YCG1_9GAST|nr:protein szt2-like isoform x1 [Plakobranchus ocellatus]